jgi:hypothetical protein
MRLPWRRRPGRHAAGRVLAPVPAALPTPARYLAPLPPVAASAAPAAPAAPQGPVVLPSVGLVFGDGSSVALPPNDPRARPFQLVARELGRVSTR